MRVTRDGFRGAGGDGLGANTDTLIGLQGDDVYCVYGVTDFVIEDRDGGGDIIYTSASYSLATNDVAARNVVIGTETGASVRIDEFIRRANVAQDLDAMQIEVLSTAVNAGTDPINLGGNEHGNIITGNYGRNYLSGGGMSAGGVDVLYGLLGDDPHLIASAQTFINEAAGEGNDAIQIADTLPIFTLNAAASVDTITLLNSAALGAGASTTIGNEPAQTIVGSDIANILNGGGGGTSWSVGAATTSSWLPVLAAT